MIPLASIGRNEIVGNYIIDKYIAEGGMGQVFLARHLDESKVAAVKVLRPGMVSEEDKEAFKNEIRLNLRISHINFVKAYEAGLDSKGRYFLAMEYIKGDTLQKYMSKNGRFDEVQTLLVALTVARALKNIWDNWQIIHRDIKPDNILITQANVIKIMDLGISTPLQDSRSEKNVIGTPSYMSPEQIETPADIDQRSDIYSLGATLYEILGGVEPFNGNDRVDIYKNVLRGKVRSLRELRPQLSRSTCSLIEKFMHKDRKNRPLDWQEAIDIIIKTTAESSQESIVDAPEDLDLVYCMKSDLWSYRVWIFIFIIGVLVFLVIAGLIIEYGEKF